MSGRYILFLAKELKKVDYLAKNMGCFLPFGLKLLRLGDILVT